MSDFDNRVDNQINRSIPFVNGHESLKRFNGNLNLGTPEFDQCLKELNYLLPLGRELSREQDRLIQFSRENNLGRIRSLQKSGEILKQMINEIERNQKALLIEKNGHKASINTELEILLDEFLEVICHLKDGSPERNEYHNKRENFYERACNGENSKSFKQEIRAATNEAMSVFEAQCGLPELLEQQEIPESYIRVDCHRCEQVIEVNENAEGQHFGCPNCGATLVAAY